MKVSRREAVIVLGEFAFLLIVLVVLWLDEYVDLPLHFGAAPSEWRLYEYLIESVAVFVVGVLAIAVTVWLLLRIRRIERFLRVCGRCKHVCVDDRWIPFEEYLSENYQLKSSHGICPTCSEGLLEAARRRQEMKGSSPA